MSIGATDPVGCDAAAAVLARAGAALAAFENGEQSRVDDAVRAAGWALYRPENAERLARLAVEETGLGNVADKIVKNRRKTLGTLRDLMRVRSVGRIAYDGGLGIASFAKPVGIVAALCPSTNPAATAANKTMMALKGGNAVVLAPSPSAFRTVDLLSGLIRDTLHAIGHPKDLVQVLPQPVTRARTLALVEGADLAVVTGSQTNVRAAMKTGTPTIGVGAGNVPVVVDSSADPSAAAEKIMRSKTFDNATSCSSENALVLLDDVYEETIQALCGLGAWRCSPEEANRIADTLWKSGALNRDVIAKDASVLAAAAGLPSAAGSSKLFLVERDTVPAAGRFADEKLSLVLTVFRAGDFDEAVSTTREILAVRGRGHSVGIHTASAENAAALANAVDVCRVLVNQAHAFGNGGSFDNGLPFTLSMGGGTWAGNTIDENLNWRHFVNVTRLVETIPEDRPSETALFNDFLDRYAL